MTWLRRVCYNEFSVLYVDENPEGARIFEEVFNQYFRVSSALGTEAGLKALDEHPSVAVVVAGPDIHPLTGIEFLRAASRTFPPKIPILITRGRVIDAVIEAVDKDEIFDYVTEPTDYRKLYVIIRRGISYCSLARERELLIRDKKEGIENMAKANRLSDIGILAASIAHEVNNPLVSISVFFDMLPRRLQELREGTIQWDDPFLSSYREVVRDEVKRLGELVRELLDFSQMSEPPSERGCDLNETVEAMLTLMGQHLRVRGISVVKELTGSLPELPMPRGKMKQVVLNLLLNAAEAVKEGGMVEVSTREFHHSAKGLMVELRVRDDGEGIPRENLSTIFAPFFTTKSDERSGGLGLTICRNIVDHYSGEITVESTPGKGSVFIVTLPSLHIL